MATVNRHDRFTAPRVFVVQRHRHRVDGHMVDRHDLSAAERYGTLQYLLDGAQRLEVPQAVDLLYSGLEYMGRDDLLLLVGNPTYIGIAMIIAADVTDGRFNVLQWDRETHSYLPISIDMGFETGELK